MTVSSPSRTKGATPRFLNWQRADWDAYIQTRDRYQSAEVSRVKLFFYKNALLVDDMGWEGINHAIIRELFVAIFFVWSNYYPQELTSMGGCLLEKEGEGAGSPDLVVYVGDNCPEWTEGESRKIDLNRWAAPDLVGEISDTTLASDLAEKKQLYAVLGISEYWVIDVRGQRIFLFSLDSNGQYQQVNSSKVLSGLPVDLLEKTLLKLKIMKNTKAASWFQQQVAQLNQMK